MVVPGNEASVKDLQVGDRVGVGAMGVSCQGDVRELRDVFTYNATYEDGKTAYGGYAEYVRVDANYAFKIPEALFKIPEALPSDVAAPLLCAGVPVTFSQSPNKEEQARALGAEDFVVMLDPDAVKRAARSVHALIVTADAPNQHFVAVAREDQLGCHGELFGVVELAVRRAARAESVERSAGTF
ncbi:hypothetical protein P43SY_000526 [Pythium insidiosum]|uniref:Alcohol dehydrogenase-like N-terminal domain-containing protein n=1 Tax=Pythium insidiosum TaxID=114742 RepID=A0AAD5LLK4_PYTIN|nr:hypothetical protein P43SY_000526 [Pythium insidiosum]